MRLPPLAGGGGRDFRPDPVPEFDFGRSSGGDYDARFPGRPGRFERINLIEFPQRKAYIVESLG